MDLSGAGWRKTTQELLPATCTATHMPPPPGQYDVYPGFPIGSGKIELGYKGLAEQLSRYSRVVIDGYGGVFWAHLRENLDAVLTQQGVHTAWIHVEEAMWPADRIQRLVEPFMGGDDPLFGTRFTGNLRDFFEPDRLAALFPDHDADLSILYGCGAALAGWDAPLIYVDVPKNEIQFRSRAGSICNLGCMEAESPKVMYKRFYFVDWVALNQHKSGLLPRINWLVDEQRPDEPAWMTGDDLRSGLVQMSRNYFRVRPWFEPGVWGGHWIQKHIPQLPQAVPNYAWSFELIVPENGLVFESDGHLLEVSFDWLMFAAHQAVLGESAGRFGHEFPIRFDFLDTFDGGNLSLQCHPRLEFIREHFGESFTQDETYYILDAKPSAVVYLGFREEIDPAEFRQALERSFAKGVGIEAEQYIHTEPADKHALFLIPTGTIHCSGKDVMVLEISATPYIFTFKMYDWMRLDLEGKPRPLNIERAFENLVFERKGRERIRRELIAPPTLLDEGEAWQLIHLPTHREQFYDVHRFEFDDEVSATTGESAHVMSLVEGTSVILETENGMRQRFNYAETFVVPAAAGSYRLINDGSGRARVVKAFVKPLSEWQW